MIFTHFLCSKNHFERIDGKPLVRYAATNGCALSITSAFVFKIFSRSRAILSMIWIGKIFFNPGNIYLIQKESLKLLKKAIHRFFLLFIDYSCENIKKNISLHVIISGIDTKLIYNLYRNHYLELTTGKKSTNNKWIYFCPIKFISLLITKCVLFK